MSRAETVYIHQLLEPENVLIAGRQKRESSTLFEKWKDIDKLRAELGDEEFARREAEWQEYLKTRFDD